ncbi:uncharacterized protein LOC110453130 [Mizuhopecten yessoensis]|uniref:uncharacterized protein LOC110453130 n=1 Tax=Mizuhopecten yessoensis TaxID=6573 RepID=UPI000B45EB76|nr:uncharacterized protein LOC110453130 [Mizuhopecten yessoensis]
MGFRPTSDFDKLPLESVITEADDMLRIKICRNILVHQPVAEISDDNFDTYWECLTGAFERLLKSPSVRRESERLKSLRLPDEKIDQFKVMIQGWRKDDEDDRRKQLDQITDIVTQTGLHTESVIKAIGTQIVDNQNEKHEGRVTLFKKAVQNVEEYKTKKLKSRFLYGFMATTNSNSCVTSCTTKELNTRFLLHPAALTRHQTVIAHQVPRVQTSEFCNSRWTVKMPSIKSLSAFVGLGAYRGIDRVMSMKGCGQSVIEQTT